MQVEAPEQPAIRRFDPRGVPNGFEADELCQACNDVEEIKLRKAETAALGQFQKLDEIMKIYMLVDKVLFMSCFPTYSIEISWFR
ncbi:hypothetical protein Y1Q_0003731 [Alligator mississippiensis]|uniref:Uncharacterized protein n=1 Tax=Alligator mississippiensis TaxID=8496 RepID=A0A151MND9_ALLMI|nr:hypothetical protein Y1Q_0003731 [Alligator mississippiensis]